MRWSLIAAITLALAPSARAVEWKQSPVNGHWYAVTAGTMTADHAEAYAQSFGGHLATIRSDEENQWANTLLVTGTWMGLTDLAEEDGWVWASGEPLTYTKWATNQPNGGTAENHTFIQAANWHDADGDKIARRGLMEVVSNDKPPSETSYPLVTGWTQSPHSSLWYGKSIMGLPAKDAHEFAESIGGHLLAIRSAEENLWIRDTFIASGKTLWIGLNDVAKEGTFVWSNGEPLGFTSWKSGQPDDAQGADYTLMKDQAEWLDGPVSQIYKFVVQRPYPPNVSLHGHGCEGSGAIVPNLEIYGAFEPGHPLNLHIKGGLGNSIAFIFMSTNVGQAPLNSTCDLNLATPLLPLTIGPIALGGFGAGNGSTTIFATFPQVALAGTFAIQSFVLDPTVLSGFSNTAALRIDPISP